MARLGLYILLSVWDIEASFEVTTAGFGFAARHRLGYAELMHELDEGLGRRWYEKAAAFSLMLLRLGGATEQGKGLFVGRISFFLAFDLLGAYV